MISVIICSIDRGKFERASAMYRQLIPQVEIVGIHDAASMAEGYSRGIAQSRGEFLIFSHDDVQIINPDFETRLMAHLNQFDLVGIAGTTKLVGPGWMGAGASYFRAGGAPGRAHSNIGWMCTPCPRGGGGNRRRLTGS